MTNSLPLSVLAGGYAVTVVVMLPYLFYRGLWPQLIAWISADPQTSGWLWLEWHVAFIGSTIAYYVVRDARAAAAPLGAAHRSAADLDRRATGALHQRRFDAAARRVGGAAVAGRADLAEERRPRAGSGRAHGRRRDGGAHARRRSRRRAGGGEPHACGGAERRDPEGGAAKHPVVTISVGVAATREAASTSAEALAAAADRARYRAKREGRNRVAEAIEPVAIALPDA